MSEECTHDCSSCGKNCSSRTEGEKVDFSVPLNAASKVKKVIAVASGKGGVGKSFVTTMLAVAAMKQGLKVGILDADVTGPSIPKAFGLSGNCYNSEDGIEPAVTTSGIRVMSLNMLVENPGDPVVWRGPVIAGLVKQFWSEVHWGELDVMFVDMPPGTGDVPLTVFQSLPVEGVVIVSSPQDLVEMIVSKSVRMCEMMKKKPLALVENMSYFVCPDCGKRVDVFGTSKAKDLAAKFKIPVSIQLPMNPAFAERIDAGAAETLEIPEFEAFASVALGLFK